jgi:dTDP-4-amino-4,6-dideoxygalactose transaminase
MAQGIYKITEEFENKVAEYTGSPYAVALDSMSSALFLCLYYENVKGLEISIPCRTYMSVPCEIIHAGAKVKFLPVQGNTIKGAYKLEPTNIWDCALRFTADMYIPGSYMCLSFTGPYKHLKLSKGGMILTDNIEAYKWFKKARFSGRNECSYHEDNFDMIGWNFYMIPELATRGLLLMNNLYNLDGSKKSQEDLELPYPDLSKYQVYQNA